MSQNVDYYFSMQSPWAYIGHAPFMEVVRRHDVNVTYKPISLPDVFAKTGACRSANVTRRGYAIASLNCSAGARSAG